MDILLKNKFFHIFNTIFEGSIGLCHLFLPDRIYAFKKATDEQLLLSKFIGLMMIAVSIMSYRGKDDLKSKSGKAIMEGLGFYHLFASIINATIGCGVDGNHDNPSRDYMHTIIHGFLSFGFIYQAYLKTNKNDKDE